ncbi:MAG: TolC family protein [Puniceicoccaceae bacterium]
MKFNIQALLLVLPVLMQPSAHAEETLSLEEAVNITIQNNYAYRIAKLNPEISKEVITRQESAFDTQLFASGSVSQTEQSATFSQVDGTSSDSRNWRVGARKQLEQGTIVVAQTNLNRRSSNAGVNIGNLSQSSDFSVTVRQPLMNGFGREANTAALERARAGLLGSIESYKASVQSILANMEIAYWTVARWQEQLQLDESNLRVAEALLEEAQERQRVGMVTQIEVLQAEAAKAQRMEEIISTKQALGDAFDRLLAYMGTLPNNADPEPTHMVQQLDNNGEAIPEFAAAWNQALRTDPLLAAQEATIQQREWDEIAARSAAKPNLDLVVTGAYAGVDDDKAQTAIENAIDRDGHAWSVGVEFSMPWNLRGEKADLRIAGKQLEQENIRLLELKQELFREVRSAWRSLQSVQQSVEAASLTVKLQEAAYEREKGKYEEGFSAFRDVLEAQNDLDQARIRLLRSKLLRRSSEIELARLSGNIFNRHGITPAMPKE